MGSRKGLTYAVTERLLSKMAEGVSRREAKKAIREEHGKQWTVSTEHIHSWATFKTYQQRGIEFARWAQATHGIKRLEDLDAAAPDLVPLYLRNRLNAGKSPYTLQTERAALRMLFGDRALAADVQLPRRTTSAIRNNRGQAKRLNRFQPAHWPLHMAFVCGAGLRKHELIALRAGDIYAEHDGSLWVHVRRGKGGKQREAPVLPDYTEQIRAIIRDQEPEAKIFERVPDAMGPHRFRRQYAQALYLHLAGPGYSLPEPGQRILDWKHDPEAIQRVSWALGHNRLDVVIRHYLRIT